jgi:hypothetical protein
LTSVDFHAQCESYVRISIKDLNGKYGVYLDADHPDPGRYPGVKVAACELAAGHLGECEMFVEGEGGVGEPYEGHWLAWHYRSKFDELQSVYRWTVHSACCPAQSPAGWHCNRYANHAGGHAFIIEN